MLCRLIHNPGLQTRMVLTRNPCDSPTTPETWKPWPWIYRHQQSPINTHDHSLCNDTSIPLHFPLTSLWWCSRPTHQKHWSTSHSPTSSGLKSQQGGRCSRCHTVLPSATSYHCRQSAHPGVTPHIPRWSFHIPDSPSARNSSVNKDSQNHSFPRWVKLWDYSPTRHVFTEMVIENPLRHNNPKMTAKIIFLFCTSLISFCLDTNKSIATAVMLPFSDNCPCSSTTLSASFIFSSNPCKALHSKVFVLSRFTRKNTGSGSLGNLFNSTVRVSNGQTQTQLYLSSYRVM